MYANLRVSIGGASAIEARSVHFTREGSAIVRTDIVGEDETYEPGPDILVPAGTEVDIQADW